MSSNILFLFNSSSADVKLRQDTRHHYGLGFAIRRMFLIDHLCYTIRETSLIFDERSIMRYSILGILGIHPQIMEEEIWKTLIYLTIYHDQSLSVRIAFVWN
jgi:hypothetical protein